MALRIINPGAFTSIQGLPDYRFIHLGLSSGGAMDLFAAYWAKYLIKNKENAFVVEMHFPGAEMQFGDHDFIALTGADFNYRCGYEHLAPWRLHSFRNEEIMKPRGLLRGSRAYIAIPNGIEAIARNGETIPASQLIGKPLQPGDVLVSHKAEENGWTSYLPEVDARLVMQHYLTSSIDIIPGPEWHLLNEADKKKITEDSFYISTQSNRMGYRLIGPALESLQQLEPMLSSPVDRGVVQGLPDGQLLVLMADHPATGGYPRLFTLTHDAMNRLAQHNPGEKVQFRLYESVSGQL
jgi:antagonist of KipI